MKKLNKVILVLLIVGVSAFLLLRVAKEKVLRDLAQPVAYPSVTVGPTLSVDANAQIENSLFVPYWTLNSDLDAEYDSYIYFGVAVNPDGIAMNEAGAVNIETFVEKVPAGKKKLLLSSK